MRPMPQAVHIFKKCKIVYSTQICLNTSNLPFLNETCSTVQIIKNLFYFICLELWVSTFWTLVFFGLVPSRFEQSLGLLLMETMLTTFIANG